MRLWMMTPAVAEAFFEQCLYREAVTEAERVAILQEMADAHKLEVFDVNASKEEIVKALSAHYRTWTVSKKVKEDA